MNGMEEVIDLENRIRALMPRARDAAPIELVTAAIAVMQGLPKVGTRLNELRRVAAEMENYQ